MMISLSFVSLFEDFCQFPFQFISIDNLFIVYTTFLQIFSTN